MKSLLKKIVSLLIITAFIITLCACNTNSAKCESGHTWELVSTTATCLSSGTESYKCSICNETKTEEVDAYGHNFVQVALTSPTCKTTGNLKEKCSCCDFEKNTTLLTIDCDYQVKSIVPSTCTVKGSQILECSMCHNTKTVELGLKNHDYKLVKTNPSTCSVHGLEEYKCKDCTATKREKLPLANHTYKTETIRATCFTHGATQEKCKDCGYVNSITNETPLLSHEFGADGYCAKCGIYKTLFDTDKLDTNWTGTPIGTIRGKLPIKFKEIGSVLPDIYWKDHSVTLTISMYDKSNNLLESHSFNSTTIPFEGANYGKLTIQYLSVDGEIGDFKANEFVVIVTEGDVFSYESCQKCTSFKLELSCQGYESIEKTYDVV